MRLYRGSANVNDFASGVEDFRAVASEHLGARMCGYFRVAIRMHDRAGKSVHLGTEICIHRGAIESVDALPGKSGVAFASSYVHKIQLSLGLS